MCRFNLQACVAAGMLVASGTASAHAFLEAATPRVGSTVQTAPDKVAIDYTQGVEPLFSTIEVQDASGTRVDKGDVHLAPGDEKRLVVDLKPIAAGTYKVIWHVTSVDTHKTEGSFTFTVSH